MPGRAVFIFLLLWIIITSFSSCKNGTVNPYSNCASTSDSVIPLIINMGDTLNLYLDSLMVLGITTPIDYHEKENRLYTFDNYNNRLLEYLLKPTRNIIYPENVHKIKINKKTSYFRYTSPDSLILYTYAGAELLYYSITSDSIYKRLTFINKGINRSHAAPPYASATSPVFFIGNTVIGFGFLIGESDNENPAGRTISSIIHLPAGNIRNRIPYSKVYWQNNWGGSHLRTPYTAYNKRTNKILLSLPADHNLQIIDSNWQVKEIPAGTRKKICINSMNLAKNNKKVVDAEYALQYFTSTPSYRNIIYDQYHNRYYRILELPPAEDKMVNRKLVEKEASLIAFDKDFKYLGEASLPQALALDNFFITADGIYFLNVHNKDQNIAQYVQCKIEL
ncbi:protein of unknown function [Chitinophaga sp. CF118]|uniref:DUF4221 family protein n=1 Tax=Chitinophaga sp. CF118 TaxID=1884367 RepID=UPI0008E4DE8A|nr:DUF4221 family protein [Chitinophaga sp. CF118]SFF02434.1 protein of unknown function [Chitinophaga sp. CF118]